MMSMCIGFCLVLAFGNFVPVLATVSVDAGTDTLRYDSFTSPGSGVRFSLDSSYYWISVKFTADSLPFTLEAVQFRMDNTKINFSDGCTLFVTENGPAGPVFPVPSGRFEDVTTIVNPPITNDFMTVGLNDSVRISLGDTFWIVMGPVPGGPDTGPTSGWWGFRDTVTSTGRSIVSFDDRQNWDSLAAFTAGKGNWVIRAVGELARGFNVVINELMFRPDTSSDDIERNHSWTELYNPGPEQAGDLVRMFLTNRLMTDTVTLPTFDFPPNSFLVVHFIGGTNDLDFSDNKGAVFFDRPDFFDDRSDACALFSRDTFPSSTGQIRDIISWDARKGTLGFSFQLQGAEVLAHEAGILGIFPEGDFLGRSPDLDLKCGPLLFPIPGMSVGRSKGSWQDDIPGEQVSDFEFHGGPDAFAPTAGEINLSEPMVAEPAAADPPLQSPKEWTLMLYMAGDGTSVAGRRKSVEAFYFDLLNQLEVSMAGGLSNVNVVVFFDGGRMQVPGHPDGATLRGALQFDLSDTLKNFRVFPGTEVNTSDSAALRTFVSWAVDTFPAARYALAIKSDAWGWKGLLNDGEELGTSGFLYWMDMQDLREGLKAGLGGRVLEMLIFDAPFMGQIEVAAQVDSLARFLVASSEMVEPAEVDYAGLFRKMENIPLVTSKDLAMYLVDTLIALRKKEDPFAVWAAVDLDSFNLLLSALDTLANNLRYGLDDICSIGVASDNFQLRIRQALVQADHFGKQLNGMADFIDLKDFTNRLINIPKPACGNHLNGAASVATLLQTGGKVVVTRLVGNQHPDAGGLSIYFPSSREKSPPVIEARKNNMYYGLFGDYPYDLPKANLSFLIDLPYLYAADLQACYPHSILPLGQCAPSDSSLARQHPLPPVPGLNFVERHNWDEFLLRYYRPVADAGGPDVSTLVNQTISFDGSGSSDADSDSLLYHWDVDSTADGPFACDSISLEDLDKDCVDGNADERNLSGISPSYYGGFPQEREYTVTLHVWDSHDIASPPDQRHFQTDTSTIRADVQEKVLLVYEDNLYINLYDLALNRIGKGPVTPLGLTSGQLRSNVTPSNLRGVLGSDPIIWETGDQSSSLFPAGTTDSTGAVGALGRILTDTLIRAGVAVFSRHLGQEFAGAQAGFFNTYFKLTKVSSNAVPCSILVAKDSDSTFLAGLGPLRLKPGVMLESVKVLPGCDFYPVLFCNDTNSGMIAAAVNIRDLGSFDRGAFFASFGLENIRLDFLGDSAVMDTFLTRLVNWLSHPSRGQFRAKGDLNDDCNHSPADVVAMLNCVFLQTGNCDLSFTDMNCSADLTPADVVVQLNLVFLGIAPPC